MKRNYVLFVVFALLFLTSCKESEAKKKKPLIWDIEKLAQMKKDSIFKREVENIIVAANRYCSEPPVSVTDNARLFEPNCHYYCSLGQYWWPDSSQVGKYINKDGVINPESRNYDIVKLEELSNRSKILSQAFYFTEDEKYYRAFLRQLHTWFIDEKTYMAPNFEYAQVVPGYHNNKGKSSGMIDAYFFNNVIDGICLVNDIKIIDKHTMKQLKKWFLDFADWSETTYSKVMKDGTQNISLAYDVMLMNFYLFAGKDRKAKIIAENFAKRRIFVQIKEDGSQPEELCRSKAFSYSVYNLTHIIDFCYLVRYWDLNYYSKYGDRINAAFFFLQKYIDKPESFPFQQITNWDNCVKSFSIQMERRNRLMTK